MKNFFVCTSVSAIAMAILVNGSAALAQAAEPAQPAEQAEAGLEEIVVTAQRRAQNQQEVPIAVTTLTASALNMAGIGSTDQLLAVSPGVTIQHQLAGATPFIRGIGTQNTAPGIESAVATYVDGVYYVSANANIFNFNNVQQVEILRGPQGTLFGRNATGGLLSITTRTPQAEPTFKGSLSYGNYETVEASVYASAGTDTLAFDIAGQLTHQGDGYGRNLLTNADVNYRREKGIRSKILWTPTSNLNVTLSGDYSKIESNLGFILQPIPGALSIIGTPAAGTRFDSNANLPQYNDTRYYGGSVKVEYDLGEIRLSSLSAYRNLDVFFTFDQDSTPAQIVDVYLNDTQHSFQQEFLAQGKTGKLNYTAGLFYFSASAGYSPLGVRSVSPTTNFDLYGKLNTKSYAAFGQVDYDVTDTTTVTAGVRYTIDKRDYSARLLPPGADPSVPANVIVGAVASKKFPKLTWRFAVNQKLGEDVNLYGSYSRGFKSGVFATSTVSTTPIRPETIDAFEAGLKSEFLDRSLRFNVAGFYYDYKDIQLNRIENGGAVLLNAARGRSYGGELETSYVVRVGSGNLTLNGSLSYLHARYKSFPDGPIFTPTGVGGNTQTVGDLAGNHMIHAPEFTASIGGNYTVPVGIGSQFELSGNFFHSASFFWEPDNRVKQRPYDLLNAQAAVSFADGRYKLRVFGKNLTKSFYYSFVTASGLGDLGGPADPRTYGIGFDLNF